jgi:hypothetical protein
VGYLVDSVVAVFASTAFKVWTVTFLGEFLLAVWLVVWGRRIKSTESLRPGNTIGGTR